MFEEDDDLNPSGALRPIDAVTRDLTLNDDHTLPFLAYVSPVADRPTTRVAMGTIDKMVRPLLLPNGSNVFARLTLEQCCCTWAFIASDADEALGPYEVQGDRIPIVFPMVVSRDSDGNFNTCKVTIAGFPLAFHAWLQGQADNDFADLRWRLPLEWRAAALAMVERFLMDWRACPPTPMECNLGLVIRVIEL